MTTVKKTIAVLAGDGIGPEIMRVALDVLRDCEATFGHKFTFKEYPFGGVAIDQTGEPLPEATIAGCKASDAILLGAIGGSQWDTLPLAKRPEAGLLALRKGLGLYINLRPTKLRPALRSISPLREERLEGCDFEIVRELAGDIYFGEHSQTGEKGKEVARDVAEYSVPEIERVARYAFERAEARRGKLMSVDKANILMTSTLWRQTVTALGREYPKVTLDHMYVDNASMQILLKPAQFDVIVTGNLFGDILTDEAAALAGSIGLIPSMSRGRKDQPALYEPIHGSAPPLAGKDIASPVAMILSASMMLRESFGLNAEAEWIEAAVDRVFERGVRTADIAAAGARAARGSELAEQVRHELREAPVPQAK